MDLPAYCVILKSVRAYRGLGGFQDVDRATLIQMVGRAGLFNILVCFFFIIVINFLFFFLGRPSYDTHGVAVM